MFRVLFGYRLMLFTMLDLFFNPHAFSGHWLVRATACRMPAGFVQIWTKLIISHQNLSIS
jgi:hypothetical protein